MKQCTRFSHSMDDYIAGRCQPEIAHWMAGHVAACVRCREEEAAARAVRTAVRAEIRRVQGQVPDPAGALLSTLHGRIVQRATTHAGRCLSLPRRRGRAVAGGLRLPAVILPLAAMLLALLFCVGLFFRRGPDLAWEPHQGRTAPPPLPELMAQASRPDAGHVSRRIRVTDTAVKWRVRRRGDLDGVRMPVRFRGIGEHGSRPGSGSHHSGGAAKAVLPFPAALPAGDDLAYLNGDLLAESAWWTPLSRDEWERIEAHVRQSIRVRDDFVQIPFPRLVSTSARQVVAAVERYKQEAAVVDARLFRTVSLQVKATALSDLCDRLRSESGIDLVAGRSVADEKVSVFCEKMPLRDVMRQLSRPFGYSWLRSGKTGEYRYELAQDLRSQLLEEELRNRDRNEALLALDREMSQYRPLLELSPEEALARAKAAPPAEKQLLEHLAGSGWGPAQLYFRLSPQDQAALRAGRSVIFRAEPQPGEQPLPAELARGVLQSLRSHRVVMRDGRAQIRRAEGLSDGLLPAAVPEARAEVRLGMVQSELGQFTLMGFSGFRIGTPPLGDRMLRGDSLAIGTSSSVLQPENAVANARLAHDPALRPRVSIPPGVSYRAAISAAPSLLAAPRPAGAGTDTAPEPRVTTADVLEALHHASGLPIVADFYTRLYPLSAVSMRNQPLFDALNRLADAMRLRWRKEGGWLQFRSASFFHDRLKEVPNRLLARWSSSRQQHGALALDDLIEIAQLSDAQLDAAGMAEGARICFGLEEWDLARNSILRPHLRWMAGFSPAQRQQLQSAAGLPFTQLSLIQQQPFVSLALDSSADQFRSLEQLAGTILRVDYTLPGGYQWTEPDEPNSPPWLVSHRPPVRERIREAALQAARRIDPQVSEAQIVPSELALAILYLPPRGAHLSPLIARATPTGSRSTRMMPIPPEWEAASSGRP